MKFISCILPLLILFCFSCEKEDFGELLGTVKNEYGQPLEGAVIAVGSSTTVTNSAGEYYFKKVSADEHSVSASLEYYMTAVQNITIIADRVNILDFILTAGGTSLFVSDSMLNVTSEAGSVNINIVSNAAWIIENNSSWMDCSVESGTGNASVRISWAEHIGSTNRMDSIEVKSGGISKSIVLSQDFPFRLLSYKGIIGNGEKGIVDSVLVLFNKPITVDRVESRWQNCLSEIRYNLVENNYGVRFSYACGTLGREYPFSITVKDEKGITYQYLFTVPFYDNKLEIEGYITDFLLTEDGKHCWITTINPGQLYYVSTDSLKPERIYSLDFKPKQIVFNPYNQLLYITGGGDPNNSSYDNHIYALDQESGSIVKTITIEPEADDHPQSAAIYPVSIGFTNTGYGIVTLMEGGASGQRWRIIDSAWDDTLYRHEDFNALAGFNFPCVYTNYDKTKLLITSEDDSYLFMILDGNTHKFKELLQGVSIERGFITQNRNNNTVYAGKSYGQFICDLDGNMSEVLYISNTYFSSADFSYRQGENNIIYFCDQAYFRVLDYNQPAVLMSCDVLYELSDIISTLDGKYVFAYKKDYPSQLYRFITDDFYRHINK